MDVRMWAEEALPALSAGAMELLGVHVAHASDLTSSRGRLAAQLARNPLTAGAAADDVERLLLAYEELASNGLRHGRPPVQVTVSATTEGWLIVVTDGGVDEPPSPAVDRDPSQGGLGLYLVARLCTAHGWTVDEGRKHVWACITKETRR